MNFENKVLRNNKLGKELLVKVTQNETNGRIFVEFSSEDGKLVVQKSFQDSFEGLSQAKIFESSFKSIKDLKKYLRLI